MTDCEYCVLVTSPNRSVLEIAQRYRDRGDCENNYDENKNQWGLGGFATKDLASTRIMAAVVALISNWWSFYTPWRFLRNMSKLLQVDLYC